MNDEAINVMYNVAVQEGYTKDKNDFINGLKTNPDMLSTMYNLAVQEGYPKSIDDFKTLMGISGGTSTLVYNPKTKKRELAQSGEIPIDESLILRDNIELGDQEIRSNMLTAKEEAQLGLTAPGRAVASIVDVGTSALGDLFRGGLKELDDYVEQFGETFYTPEHERNIAGQLLTDPSLLPSLATGSVVSRLAPKLPLIGKTAFKAIPGLNKPAIKSGTKAMTALATLGATEGVVDEALYKAGQGLDLTSDPQDYLIGGAIGGTLGALAPVLSEMGRKAFKDQIEKRPSWLNTIPEAKQDEAMNTLYEFAQPNRKLNVYDLDQTSANVGEVLEQQGKKKGEAIKDISDFMPTRTNISEFGVDPKKVLKDLDVSAKTREMSYPETDDIKEKFVSILNEYKLNNKSIDQTYSEAVKKRKSLGDDTYDPEILHSVLSDPSRFFDLNNVFNARKDVDKRLNNYYKKQGKVGLSPAESAETEALLKARDYLENVLNKGVDTKTIDETYNRRLAGYKDEMDPNSEYFSEYMYKNPTLNQDAVDDLNKRYSKVPDALKKLEEFNKYKDLYSVRDLAQRATKINQPSFSLMGGDVSNLFNRYMFPPTGIRATQAADNIVRGDIIPPMLGRLPKRLYREQTDDEYIVDQNKKRLGTK